MKKNELALFTETQRAAIKEGTVKKVKKTALSTVAVVVCVAVAVLANIILQVLDNHFNFTVDFSHIGVTQIDDFSKDYVKNMKHPIEIIVNGDERDYSSASYETSTDPDTGLRTTRFSAKRYTYELLRSYMSETDLISVSYVDVRYNPQVFKDRGITLKEDTFMTVYCPETKRDFQIAEDVFESDRYVGLERLIDGAMENVATDDVKRIGFVTCHDEELSSYLIELLQLNAYSTLNVTENDLVNPELPNLVDCLVVTSPKNDYSAEEIKGLRSFLSNASDLGKSLLVFMDADTPACPRFENFLSEWGLSYTNITVFDRQNSLTIGAHVNPLLHLMYAKNAESKDIAGESLYNKTKQLYVELGRTRAIDVLPLTGAMQTADLLSSRGSAAFGVDYTQKQLDPTQWKDIRLADDDVLGPFRLGVMSSLGGSERVDSETGYAYYSKFSYVGAFGTTSLLEEYYLSDVDGACPATAEYVLNLFRFVTGRDSYVMIYSTSFMSGVTTFENDTVVKIVCYVTIGLVPVACAVMCIWRGRKRKYL